MIKKYNHFYKKIKPEDENSIFTCYYCGLNANCFDHTPPISCFESYMYSSDEAEFYLVPSCTECNAILASYNSPTLESRFEELKRRLEKRYNKILKMGSKWTPSEIKELKADPTPLNQSIINMCLLYETTMYRLDYPGFLIQPIK